MDEFSKIEGELGEIRGELKGIRSEISRLCEFKEQISTLAERFQNYAESRKSIPQEIRDVEKRLSNVESGFGAHCILGNEESNKLKILWDQYTRWRGAQALLTGLSAAFSGIILIIVLFHEKLGITFTLR